MKSMTSENTFESAIVDFLVKKGGYCEGNAQQYSPDLGMFKQEVITFLKTSQPTKWAKLEAIHGEDIGNRLIQRLYRELDLRGSLDVLRNGFVDYGIRFQMAYFEPATQMNLDAIHNYHHQNRLQVVRQVFFSNKAKYSVDLVLSLNGIPVATLELKNQFTNQSVTDAQQQYNVTRDNRELLFAFKKRCLVHFAVDQDEIFMATKMEGSKTRWLPFNKGDHNGKGNPVNNLGYNTAYLWEDILKKKSWMDILHRFIHLQIEEYEFEGRTLKKETMIFPRYHQLNAVRRICIDVRDKGVGKNYLIQHSAGSGKSNTIAWLAYNLTSMHNAIDERLFDSVIVVTDRKVLDQQLQNTIYQFEHKSGVVQRIDKDSTQLADSLTSGTNIIITTLQKFPYVLEKVQELPNRKYGVIIDEAHSSQGGEASKKMKEVLAAKSLEDAAMQEGENDDVSIEDEVVNRIAQSADARGRQQNISFFAFTATPKFKTLQVFGYTDIQGDPAPFDLYSMRQAIEEGFILNVLENYITYNSFFKLTKAIQDDPKVPKKKAAKALGKYISLHPHNLSQKTKIIIEHFREVVSKKIGGRAKAMVVCGSRLHAKRYFEEFRRYIFENGYQDEIKILVAFSGTVIDDNALEGVTEPMLNGIGERELPNVFNKDEYRILIVAEKYQTGFDQPLLHTMYVDKKLSGVKAVQTLSRLNRTCMGKEDTFILDFVNDRTTILDSFQPYYEITKVTEETDINHLYDLRERLDQFQIYWQNEIDDFARAYFDPATKVGNPQHQKFLYGFTNNAVARFKGIEEEEKRDEFKKGLRTWTSLYSFLSQIMPFSDVESEKFFAYAKYLQLRLPRRDLAEALHLDDEVALEYYRIQKIAEGAIELQKGQVGQVSGITEAGLKKAKEEEIALSEIIQLLNDKFGTTFEAADKLFFDQIEEELQADETLKMQAQVNQIDTFKFAFYDSFIDKLFGRMEQNQEIFERILSDQAFGELVKEWMLNRVYKNLREPS